MDIIDVFSAYTMSMFPSMSRADVTQIITYTCMDARKTLRRREHSTVSASLGVAASRPQDTECREMFVDASVDQDKDNHAFIGPKEFDEHEDTDRIQTVEHGEG